MYDSSPYIIWGHASCKFPIFYRICLNPVNYREVMANLQDACPYKVRGLMNGQGGLAWNTGMAQMVSTW